MYHLSQPSQPFSQLAQLPLAKFTYTTTSIGHNGPLNWNHVIGNGDLVGIFEKWPGGSAQGRVILKVVREQEALEEIDLTHLIREANSNPSRKPSFAVIVKSPCLAVKYPNGGTYLRRFQIKFASDRDYYTALAILSDINCPFSESNLGSAPSGRKLTSSSWNVGASARESHSVGNLPASNNDLFPLQLPVPASGAVDRITGPSLSFSLPMGLQNSQNSSVMQQREPGLLMRSSPGTISRPSTATPCHDSQALERVLPPKRELPFTKPGLKRARARGGEMGATTDKNTSKNKNTQHPPSPTTASSPSAPTETPSNAVLNHQTQAPNQQSSQKTNPKQNRKLCILRLPTHALSTQPHPHVESQSQSQSKSRFQPEQQPDPDPTPFPLLPPTHLSAYHSTPTTERLSTIETWLLEHLEDEAFLGLCRDVEGVWGRIAFGR